MVEFQATEKPHRADKPASAQRGETVITDVDARDGAIFAPAGQFSHTSNVELLMDRYGPTMTTTMGGEVLHRHPSHIRKLCQEGELPAVQIGNRWHIVTTRLGAMLDGGAEW